MEPDPSAPEDDSIAWLRGSLGRRATAMTAWPASHSALAMPSPSPRLPPVTMTFVTLGITTSELARGRHRHRGDYADRRGYLVRRQRAATDLKDFGFGALEAFRVERVLVV